MKTEIVAVIDSSGSMYSLQNDTIGGYNKFIEEQVKNEIDANISTLFFDTTHKWFESDVPLNKARKLDKENYLPSGGTALNDAIARAHHVLEHKNPDKAIVVIITDGEENSSIDTSPGAVKRMITAMQARDWRIVYLAANQDAFTVGKSMGISQWGLANIVPTAAGTKSAYAAASNQSMNYLSGGTRGMSVSTQTAVDSAMSSGA